MRHAPTLRVVVAVNRERQVVLQPVRVEHADLEGWLKKHLQISDQVVIESTTNAWHVYDLLEPLTERVVVANPIKVKQIACARVKTDIRDTLILARLLAANLVPVVWVPPLHVRQLRQLLSQRRQMVETHTQILNRMHSVAHRHHLNHPASKRFNEKNTGWQKGPDTLACGAASISDRDGKSGVYRKADRKDWQRGWEDEPSKAVGGEHDLYHAAAGLWCDHSHDSAGRDR